MRVRLTLEYDTDETLDYERTAWREGNVGVTDFIALASPSGDQPGDDTITLTIEAVA